MIFVYRAAIVACATFVSALAGFGAHWVLPAAYIVESKGMVGYVVGLVASVARAEPLDLDEPRPVQHPVIAIADDRGFDHPPRLILCSKPMAPRRSAGARACGPDLDERRFSIYDAVYHTDVPEDVHRMIAFFISLRPANDEQRQYLASARDIFGTIVETQVTIFRSLVNRLPSLLLVVVLGWSCLLFFGYGLLSDVDALTIVLAALGAICVASAVLLILELSDPYSGLFMMAHESFDELVRVLTREGGRCRDVGSKFGARVRQRFTVGY